ncbi:MAG TPA: DUF2851 family protein [Chitinophagaceae bacterium]
MLLSEKLLQYIWRFGLYNARSLETLTGETLEVISPGIFNANSGPDFLHARIRIGDTVLAGNIEVHVQSSGWFRHHHDRDKQYRNVILHVVFENDREAKGEGRIKIPVLELKDRIAKLLLHRYGELMRQTRTIPCAGQTGQVDELTWESWKDRLLAERWEMKIAVFRNWLKENNYNWEETFYWAIGRNFGMPVNSAPFEELVRSLPLKLLAKHANDPVQTAALLFGQAGMLEYNFREEYPLQLQREYHFLQKKYALEPATLYPWQWLRMRPSNFPTIRIAQFAALISRSPRLFSILAEGGNLHDLYRLLQVKMDDYWQTHYRFEQVSSPVSKAPGLASIQHIVINTISPMLYLYGRERSMAPFRESAFQFLAQMPAEKNHIIREWKEAGVAVRNARDSQALLHLKKNYCDEKRCLECAVGNKILLTS